MSKKILVVVTNHDKYTKTNDPTGLWLSELVHFYHPMKAAGIQMDIASVLGGTVPLDPLSISEAMMDDITKQYYHDTAFMSELMSSKQIQNLNAHDYDAIYFTGGHGTMWDFVSSDDIAKISANIYEQGGIVSAVCHGVGALLNIKLADGRLLIAGKQVTGYTKEEEVLAGVLEKIPFILEDALVDKGTSYQKSSAPFLSFVVEDDRLITGQNPQSTTELAQVLLKKLL